MNPIRNLLALLTVSITLLFSSLVLATNYTASCDAADLVARFRSAANSTAANDTLTLAQNCVYVLDDKVNDGAHNGANGLYRVDRTTGKLTIQGNGATIQRSSTSDTPEFRLIEVVRGTLVINNLTLVNGRSTDGGALWNYGGTVTLNEVTITGSHATGMGGGIYNGGDLTVVNSTINANSAADHGGGLYNEASLTLINSTVSGNSASNQGGGIHNSGTLLLVQATLSDNSAGSNGGGLFTSAATTLHNSILGNSVTGSDCYQSGGSPVTVTGGVLVENNVCNLGGGTILNVDPQLGPLQNNGGSTATHALSVGSSAVDAGSLPLTTLATDQRGQPRIFGVAVDLGAYELQEQSPPPSLNVTIDQAKQQADPTNSVPIVFTVIFSQPVTGFSSADIDLSASTAPGQLTAQVVAALPNDGTTYTVAVSGMSGDGDVIASVAAGAAHNAASVPNEASTSSDNRVRYDISAPDITITQPTTNSALGTAQPAIHFESSDSSATFECRADSVPFVACTSPFTPPALSEGSHTVDVRASDTLGNQTESPASVSFTVDTTAPTVTISGVVTDTTNQSPLTITIHFSEVVTGFDAGDLIVGNGSRGTLTSSDQQIYTIAITPSIDGEVTVTVPANVASDAAGNMNLAAPSHYSVIYDTTAPDTTLVSGPAASSNSPNAAFVFSSPDPSATFECSLNSAPFTDCASPLHIGPLVDNVYTFAVRAKDAAGNTDSTPASYNFRVDATLPDIIISAPSHQSLINHNSVTFSFGSTDIEATFECSLNNAPFTACASPYTPPAFADGTHTFSARATDLARNQSPAATITFTVDTIAPDTTLINAPTGLITHSQPSFSFSSPESGTVFMCQLNAGDAFTCTSPFTPPALDDGPHSFSVYAVDAAGNADPTPASTTFTVDANAPDTALDATPPGLSNNSSPTFSFSSPDATATFECKLDDAAFASCSSPFTANPLADGSHTFSVRAIDAAGNSDPTPASVTFTIDTTAPTVSAITRANSSPTNQNSVGFTVTFSEAVVSVDSDDFMLATDGLSGALLTGVTGSGNTFHVTANTGSGDGTLGLEVQTGATITDLVENALSGGYTGGEVYSIVRSGPLVEQVTADIGSGTITYTVSFTTAVTGVDASDFTLSLFGINATVETVSGDSATYQVTVSWSGVGTIALQVLDDDSITDALGNPLGGVGASNGAFTSATYDNRPAPSNRDDDPPTTTQRATPPPTSTPAPPAPLLSDLDGSTHVGVRARVPESTFGVFGRVLAMDGEFVVEPAQIGSAEVLARQVLAAVDVFSPNGNAASGVQVCLRGNGHLLFLDAATSPRALSALPTTREGDMTCALLPGVGMVVLVAH